MKIESKFDIGDRVHVDGCKDLTVTVTAIQWRHPQVVNYECSWVSDAESKSVVIEGWRLHLAETKA